MKKYILSTFILSLLATSAVNAEGGLIDFGIKGGVTTQNVNFSKTAKYDDGAYGLSTNGRFGYHLGMMSRINLPLVHFQPEILFSNTGYRINATGPGDSRASKSIIRLRTLDVPVLVGMRMMWFRLQAGPMFTVMSESKVKDRDLVADIHVTKPSVSYLLGMGLTFGHLNLDARFNGNFNKTTQDITYDNRQQAIGYKSKNKYWVFSVGYMF